MSATYTATAAKATAYVLPSDGDTASASSVNTPLEALADGLQWCFDALPHTLVARYGVTNGGTGTAISSSSTSFESTPSTASLALLSGGGHALGQLDELDIDVCCHAFGATTGAELQLAYSLDGATLAGVTGARARIDALPASGVVPISFCGALSALATASDVAIYLQIRSLSGGATVSVSQPYTAKMLQLRTSV